jgi:predicted nucleic acid-binding protein
VESELQGYRQLTDAYLLALASHRKGVMATFDRGLRALAGNTLAAALEIVPTR